MDVSGNPNRLAPFLRWVGGKQQLIAKLLPLLPDDFGERVYREPFLGGASLYFATLPRRAHLSDLNKHLVDCYRQIRDRPVSVARVLEAHAKRDCETHYYLVRDQYNNSRESASQAARFIYLNKTCYNGVFRVNIRGVFNVPYGFKEKPAIPSRKAIVAISRALKRTNLGTCDYVQALAKASNNDFVYLDPPYPPLNGTAYFTHYTKERFGESDQHRVAEIYRMLDRKGCSVMLTNADTPLIRKLYCAYDIRPILARRYVTSSSVKHRVRELVIRNYS
jgi:DNA adenine methylase